MLKKILVFTSIAFYSIVFCQESWVAFPTSEGITTFFPEVPDVKILDSIHHELYSYKTEEELFLVNVVKIDKNQSLDSSNYKKILDKYIFDMAEGNSLITDINTTYKGYYCRYFKIKTTKDLEHPILTENKAFIYVDKVICLSYWNLTKSNQDFDFRAKAFFDKVQIETPKYNLNTTIQSVDDSSNINLPSEKTKWWSRIPYLILLILVIVFFLRLYKNKETKE